MELEAVTVSSAARDGALRYLELLELAPELLVAADPDELRELRAAAFQIGIALLAVGRRFEVDGQGSLKERALLHNLAESLLLLSIVSAVEEIKVLLLASAEEICATAAACGIELSV
jgi:hypothetical protein